MVDPDPRSPALEPARLAAARGDVYAFLGEQWLLPPIRDDQPLEALAARWGAVGLGVDEARGERIVRFLEETDSVIEALEAEYQALLRVPTGRYLTPVQSVYEAAAFEDDSWTFGRLRTKPWTEVTAAYAHAGYAVSPGDQVEADHIGCMLEFMAALCREESQAWADGHPERVNELRTAQASFLDRHFDGWLSKLRLRLDQTHELPYYPDVMGMLETYVKVEAKHLPRHGT